MSTLFIRPLIALAMLASLSTNAAQPKDALTGSWISDHDRTMDYIQRNVKMEDLAIRFLDTLMGHMTLRFSDGELHLVFPDNEVMVNGELKPFEGFESKSAYTVLYGDEREVVIRSTQPVTGKPNITTYHFDGKDVMWAYQGSSDPGVPDLHIREYFKRTEESHVARVEP